MPKSASPQKNYVALRFPSGGLDHNFPLQFQPPYSTPQASNFIAEDVLTERERGGSRPGLAAYGSIDAANAHPMLAAQEVRWLNAGVATSTLVMSSNGTIWTDDGVGNFTSGATGAYSGSSFQMTNYLQDLYYPAISAGVNVLHFNGPASTGLLTGDPSLIDPAGDGTQTYTTTGNTPPTAPANARLVIHWSDRLVVATSDVGQVFMSAQGNPQDWRYGDVLTDTPGLGVGAAVALADAPNAGVLPDIITALINHSDQCVIFGARASMHILRGNPYGGGTLSPLIDGVGVIGANAWCYDDQGYLWWMSQDGLYVMSPGCDGQMLRAASRQKLPHDLVGLSEDKYYVSLAYDRRFRGLHIVVYPISAGTPASYFISTKTSLGELVGQASFWPVDYTGFAPTICFQRPYYRPSTTTASPVVYGGTTTTPNTLVKYWDTGTACEVASKCDIGPFPLAPDGYRGLLMEIQVDTAAGADTITLGVRVGDSPEQCYLASEVTSYTFAGGGPQYTVRPRAAGAYAIIQLRGAANAKVALDKLVIRRETMAPRRLA